MDVSYVKDTIVARATAQGQGGIGIVRVSGSEVVDIAHQVLGALPAARLATLSSFKDSQGNPIDSGIALYFKGPDSFTGEDVLELQGHGGPVVLEMLLNRIVSLGARLAEPGEFSQRAFLNDKIDLAQAEAIADLINSGSQQAARSAMRSLQGQFSDSINALVSEVTLLRVYVEAAIDFPEEEIDFISENKVVDDLRKIQQSLNQLLVEAGDGALLNQGADVVLLGKPNVGKSSLMNLLSGRDTSIVTDIPGTTRDVVDQHLEIDGIPLRLVDTAGIRQSADSIEAEGIRRALAARSEADVVIAIVDASQFIDQIISDIAALDPDSRYVIVGNKTDLPNSVKTLGEHLETLAHQDILPFSAKTGEGLAALKQTIKQRLGYQGSDSTFSARTRHINSLKKAQTALVAGQRCLENDQAGELLAEELKLTQQYLSEITGEFSSDDLLGEIFSSFCIGK